MYVDREPLLVNLLNLETISLYFDVHGVVESYKGVLHFYHLSSAINTSLCFEKSEI